MAHQEHAALPTRTPSAVHRHGTVVVSGTASDAHTWNLVHLQLVVEELGHPVVNLGPCVPDEVLIEECRRIDPVLVVLGSVNGHGCTDGLRVARRLRGCPDLAATPLVIGGKLTVSDEDPGGYTRALLAAGFDAVFPDHPSSTAAFRDLVTALPPAPAVLSRRGPE